MLRKILFSSSLLLASGFAFADIHEGPVPDIHGNFAFDFEDDEEEALDDRSERERIVDMHNEMNVGNAPVNPTFHIDVENNRFLALLDLTDIDHESIRIQATGKGFLTITLRESTNEAFESDYADEYTVLVHSLFAPLEKISAEVSTTDNALFLSIPLETEERELEIQFKTSIDEISLFKSETNVQASAARVEDADRDEL